MNKVDAQTSPDVVVEQARLYLKENGLNHQLPVREVFYHCESSEAIRALMEKDLGRALDEDALGLLERHNKPGWVVQFASEACEVGATPQGPAVLLYDDGSASHYRPM